MKIHLLSDLHNEFSRFVPEVLDADVGILVGNGDEWSCDLFSCVKY